MSFLMFLIVKLFLQSNFIDIIYTSMAVIELRSVDPSIVKHIYNDQTKRI